MQTHAKRALREISDAEDKTQATAGMHRFEADFAKWPKAVVKITKDRDALLAFYDFPAEHWLHLRTSNAIESTFAPVRARTNVTKGPGSREAGTAMVFKLLEAAEGSGGRSTHLTSSRSFERARSSRTVSWSNGRRERTPRDSR